MRDLYRRFQEEIELKEEEEVEVAANFDGF